MSTSSTRQTDGSVVSGDDDEARGFHEIGEWDWWIAHRGILLHAAEVAYDASMEVAGEGTTTCGRKLRLWIPGIFARLGARRCRTCCDRLGFPQGVGSPKNDAACRPLVEARLARRGLA